MKNKLIKLIILSTLVSQIKAVCSNTALYYVPTPMNKGLSLQLHKEYKTHWTIGKKNKFKDILIKRPEQLLKINKKVEQLFQKKLSLITPEWFEKQSQSNPLCLISECSGTDCPLNRFNTSVRQEFETLILKTIKDDFKDFDKNKDTLNYTSFACGGLFPDLVILTKLIEQGFKKININLIDTAFKEYVDTLQNKGDTVALDVFDQENRDKGIWLRGKTYNLVQFLEWFSNSEISVNLYGSAKDYIEECLNISRLKSDIIVGVDYIESFPLPAIDYIKLVYSALKKNRYAFSVIGALNSNQSRSTIYKKISEPSGEDINFINNLQLKVDIKKQNPYTELYKILNIMDPIIAKDFEITNTTNDYKIKQIRSLL